MENDMAASWLNVILQGGAVGILAFLAGFLAWWIPKLMRRMHEAADKREKLLADERASYAEERQAERAAREAGSKRHAEQMSVMQKTHDEQMRASQKECMEQHSKSLSAYLEQSRLDRIEFGKRHDATVNVQERSILALERQTAIMEHAIAKQHDGKDLAKESGGDSKRG
jgi:hypothetical protein